MSISLLPHPLKKSNVVREGIILYQYVYDLEVPRLKPLLSGTGAILVLGRDLVMVPKLIHPLPPNEVRTPTSSGELDEEPPTPHPLNETWMQVGTASTVTTKTSTRDSTLLDRPLMCSTLIHCILENYISDGDLTLLWL